MAFGLKLKEVIIFVCIGLVFDSCSFDDIVGREKKDDTNGNIFYVVKAIDGTEIFYIDSEGEENFTKILAPVHGAIGTFSVKTPFIEDVSYRLRVVIKTEIKGSLRMSIMNDVRNTHNEFNFTYEPLKIFDPPIFQKFSMSLSGNFKVE